MIDLMKVLKLDLELKQRLCWHDWSTYYKSAMQGYTKTTYICLKCGKFKSKRD